MPQIRSPLFYEIENEIGSDGPVLPKEFRLLENQQHCRLVAEFRPRFETWVLLRQHLVCR